MVIMSHQEVVVNKMSLTRCYERIVVDDMYIIDKKLLFAHAIVVVIFLLDQCKARYCLKLLQQ